MSTPPKTSERGKGREEEHTPPNKTSTKQTTPPQREDTKKRAPERTPGQTPGATRRRNDEAAGGVSKALVYGEALTIRPSPPKLPSTTSLMQPPPPTNPTAFSSMMDPHNMANQAKPTKSRPPSLKSQTSTNSLKGKTSVPSLSRQGSASSLVRTPSNASEKQAKLSDTLSVQKDHHQWTVIEVDPHGQQPYYLDGHKTPSPVQYSPALMRYFAKLQSHRASGNAQAMQARDRTNLQLSRQSMTPIKLTSTQIVIEKASGGIIFERSSHVPGDLNNQAATHAEQKAYRQMIQGLTPYKKNNKEIPIEVLAKGMTLTEEPCEICSQFIRDRIHPDKPGRVIFTMSSQYKNDLNRRNVAFNEGMDELAQHVLDAAKKARQEKILAAEAKTEKENAGRGRPEKDAQRGRSGGSRSPASRDRPEKSRSPSAQQPARGNSEERARLEAMDQQMAADLDLAMNPGVWSGAGPSGPRRHN